MADLLNDGNSRVYWVASGGIANIAAPTTTELNAGVRLDQLLTPDGLKEDSSTADIDLSFLSSTFNTASAGRRKFDIAVVAKRQTPTDTVLNLLPYRTSGYLVVRDTVDANTAWTAAQKCRVYPVQTGEPMMAAKTENSVARFTSPMYMTAEPNTSATVA
jgi:hypothetical protein